MADWLAMEASMSDWLAMGVMTMFDWLSWWTATTVDWSDRCRAHAQFVPDYLTLIWIYCKKNSK
jgi:hypothetical protein